MTKSTQTANSNKLLVTTDIQIRTEDLVAIQVADFEHKLLGEQAEHEANIRDIKKNIAATEKALKSEIDGLGAAAFSPKDAISELAKLGIKVKAIISSSISEEGVLCTLTLSKDEGGYNSSWESEKNLPVTEGIKAKQALIESDSAKLANEQTKLVDVRRKLSQIGTIERQARAKIASNTLSKMEGGADLLASLGEIKGLPQLPAPK